MFSQVFCDFVYIIPDSKYLCGGGSNYNFVQWSLSQLHFLGLVNDLDFMDNIEIHSHWYEDDSVRDPDHIASDIDDNCLKIGKHIF